MNNLRWPRAMPAGARLSEGKTAFGAGFAKVRSPVSASRQVVHINLFFDGTKNNDDQKNPFRDSRSKSHTNVARSHNICKADPTNGAFRYYSPELGTHRRLLGPAPVSNPSFERHCRFRVPYDALRAQGMRDTAQLLRALSHGFSNDHLDWSRTELRPQSEDLFSRWINEGEFFDKIDRKSVGLRT